MRSETNSRCWTRQSKALLAAAAAMSFAAMLAWATPASAVLVVSDGFGDADRNNDGTPDGATATDAADAGLKWYAIGGLTSGTTPEIKPGFTIVPNDTILGGGNSMHIETRGANSEFIGVLPTALQIGPNVGDAVRLSFRFRIDSSQTPAFTTPGDGPSDQRIVFGLYRDADGELGTGGFGTADGDFDVENAPGAGDDPGIHVRVPVWVDDGQAQGARVNFESANQGDSILTGGTTFIAGTNDAATTFPGIAANDLGAHTFTLTLTRFDALNNIHARLQMDQHVFEDVRETTPFVTLDTFNYLVFTAGTTDFDFAIDSVAVESIPVPEPASLAVAAVTVAAGSLGRRRRRRHC